MVCCGQNTVLEMETDRDPLISQVLLGEEPHLLILEEGGRRTETEITVLPAVARGC